MKRVALGVFLVVGLGMMSEADVCLAQQADTIPEGPQATAERLAARLKSGQRVRIEAGSTRIEGLYRGVAGTSLIVEGSSRTAFALADMDRLWVRGRSTTTGALVGGLLGSLAGAAIGSAFANFACAETGGGCGLEGGLLGGLIFGAGGAGAGALVGLAIPQWKQRFP